MTAPRSNVRLHRVQAMESAITIQENASVRDSLMVKSATRRDAQVTSLAATRVSVTAKQGSALVKLDMAAKTAASECATKSATRMASV
jgi:hypothetical protein